MSNVSNADYIASIEQSASAIGAKLDSSVVKSVKDTALMALKT